MKILEGLPVSLDNEEIISLLRSSNANSKKQNSKPPSLELLENIYKMKEVAKQLIKPKAIYDVFPSKELKPRHMFKRSEQTILAICTISSEIEEKIDSLMKKGELSEGVILDAIASQAAEEVATEVNNSILNENVEILKNKKYTARFSPGYCRWQLAEGQELIFSLLSAEKIDVKLSNSKMMIPRKSISFAINIGDNVEKELGMRDCDNCDLLNCGYRRS